MKIRPISFRDACAFVKLHHRHHKPPQGNKFSVQLVEGQKTVGVVIVSRPVARNADDGLTYKVTRLCTDGTKNAASKLYGAARRIAGAMGYERCLTFTLESEPGTSLFAAGWQLDGLTDGGGWDRPNRTRKDDHPTCPKKRWVATT